MLRLALLSGRGRRGTFAGALVALMAASVLTTAWGMQLESVLRGHPPVERYAGAAAVVTGQQIIGPDHDVPLSERARVSSALTSRLAAVPGVRAAIGDVSVPVRLGDREAVAHGWGSASLITLIPVTAAFAGLALFIAMFVVTSTMGLSIQQREREIALLRAVAATPRQIRRMIGWEAALVGLVGSAAGVWPGMLLGKELGHALVRHGIVPSTFTVDAGWIPAAAAVAGGVAVALLAVLAAGRRAARVRPTVALADAAVEPRLIGPGRLVGGLLALAGAVPLFAVSTTTRVPETAAATSEMTAI